MASKTKSAILETFDIATTLIMAPMAKAAGLTGTITTSRTSAVINGATGNEVLNGTATADTISGLGGNDTLNGLGGDDLLLGGIGNDRLDGGTGNDTLDGGTGNDTMIGGAGNDVYLVDAVGDVLSETGGSGTDRVEASISFTLATGFENLTLTGTAALTGTGNAANNVILGNGGTNVLQGGGGVDTINGGAGNDTIILTAIGLSAGSVFDGDAGVDVLLGDTVTTLANLTTVTLTELESIEGFEGGVRMTGAQLDSFTGDVNVWGDITLTTGGTVDLRDAHVYTEVIRLANLDTTLILNAGRSLAGGMFSGTVFGGTANDTITLTGFNGIGGSTLFGGAGNDVLTGSAKGDQLVGGSGRDSLFGGAGNDVLRLTRLTDLQAGETYAGGAGDDVLDGRAILQLTDFAAAGTAFLNLESIEGFRRGVTMTAAQLDQFSGEIDVWGNINIATGGVIDLSDASIFTNNIFLNNAGNQITVAGGYGIDGEGGDFEGTIHGGSGNDTITVISGYQAGLAPDIDILGGGGNDSITGGNTSEVMIGGTGRDSLAGGDGDDVMVIFDGDVAAGEIYDGGTGQDTLTGETGSAVNLSGVTIIGVEHITGFSGGLALSTTQLDGFTGTIDMSGELSISNSGAVNLGGATLILEQINLNSSGNQITVAGNTGFPGQSLGMIAGGAGNDTITVIGGTFGVQGAILLGGVGNDTITGSATDDEIVGGAGVDSLSGGAGNDVFVIGALSDIQSGEVYDGGAGQDTLDGNDIIASLNLATSGLTLTSVEAISGFVDGAQMTAAQLAAFTARVGVIGAVTVTTGGTINLGSSVVTTNQINLSAAGNAITLTAETATTSNFDGRVIGGVGNDAITVLGGDQYGSVDLFGGGGNDTILAGGGNDNIVGGAGSDSIDAGAGDDTLVAAVGDLAAGETYNGGAGTDTLDLSAITTTVNLGVATVTGIESIIAGGSLQLTAGQANGFTDSVSVNGDLILTSGGSVDFSQSDVSVDRLILSAAGNTVIVAQPNDGSASFNGEIIGGVGNDNITVLGGGYNGVTVDAGDGNDTIVSAGGNSQLTGGDGNDVITGGGGYNTMFGGAGNDTITGGTGIDQITGGTGADSLVGGGGNDTFSLETAADIVAGEVYNGGAGIDYLDGVGVVPPVDISGVSIISIERVAGFDNGLTLTAAQLAGFTSEVLVGELTLTTGGTINMAGTRFVTGSTINLSNTATNLTLTADGSGYSDPSFIGTVNGGNGDDTITMIGGGGSYYTGSTLSGGGGNDTLTGANNDVVLIGGLGTDQMFGGTGDDRFDITAASDVTAGEAYSGGAGTDTLDGSGAGTSVNLSGATLTGIEVIRGFNGGLTLTAGQVNAVEQILLSGGTLTLSNGGTVNLADTTLIGLGGIQLSNTATTLTVAGGYAGGTFAPESFTGFVEGGSAGDTITITETGSFFGGSYGATLDGNGGNDSLTGSSLNETLIGGTGADQILAGDGDDVLRIEGAADFASGETYDGGGGADTLEGISAAVDISGMAITFTGIETVEGFFGGLTLTAGQLGSIATEEINIGGTITLSGGGSVDLSGIRLFSETIQLSNAGNSIAVAAWAPSTTKAGFSGTITGGNGNDTITVVNPGNYSGGGGTFIFNGGAGADTINGLFGQSETIIGGIGNDVLNGGGGGTYADIFVFGAINSGADSIQNFAGSMYGSGDRIQITGGASSAYWVDTGAFLGGGQTSVRFATGLLRVDYDGNGTQDFTINMNGLTEADFTQSTFI